MIDPEVKRFIVQEIRKNVHIVLSGAAGSHSSAHTESIKSLYPGMSEIPDRPLAQPYGFASKATADTISVVLRQGDHPGSVMTVAHRDKDKPSDITEGESAQYSSGKYQIRTLNGKIQLGKDGAWETVIMGESLNTLLISLIDLITAHTHMGNLGFPTGFPMNKAAFDALKDNTLTPKKLLAEDGGKF